MISLGKHVYINPLSAVLFVFCFITQRAGLLLTVYSVMTLHELSHLAAALAIGLKPSHISFHPFGVNLKLGNKIVYSLADEIILYASGPLCNAVLALGAAVVFSRYPNPYIKFFYVENILLFCVNMLPVLPLDGGIILRKILACRMGNRAAGRVVRVISLCFTVALLILGGYVVYVTKFNFSVLFLAVFLAGSIFTQSEKYNIDFVKELMYYKNKPCKRVRLIIADKDESPRKTAERFVPGKYSVVCVMNKNGEIEELLTETQIVDKLIDVKTEMELR